MINRQGQVREREQGVPEIDHETEEDPIESEAEETDVEREHNRAANGQLQICKWSLYFTTHIRPTGGLRQLSVCSKYVCKLILFLFFTVHLFLMT